MNNILTPVVQDYNSFGVAVYSFNHLAGNLQTTEDPDEIVQRIKNQAERVLEEAQETIYWCERYLYNGAKQPISFSTEEMLEGILDGVIDTNVTAFGLLQLAGPYFDTQKAATKICQNNLTKFTTSHSSASETVKHYAEKGTQCTIRSTNIDGLGEVYSVVRQEDGKIMKPHDYQPVCLQDCLYLEDSE